MMDRIDVVVRAVILMKSLKKKYELEDEMNIIVDDENLIFFVSQW